MDSIFFKNQKNFINGIGQKSLGGFSLMEGLVGVAVFIIIVVSVYQSYLKVFEAVQVSRLRLTAIALANEQLEIIRHLPYDDVGIVAGIPAGKIIREQTLTKDGGEFRVITTIRNIDDPFDGTIGGSPNDLSPADYKLAELEISCLSCKNFLPLSFNSYVAPRALESASTNGALFVQVFDANGQPIQGADVHIENNQQNPPVIIDDTTNNEGILQVVDAPPGAEAYEITVSKSGYSQEETYPTGAPENPNPTKPHATVAVQQLTQISFAIDKISALDVASVTETCAAVPNIDFALQGSKLIGTDPNVLKYTANHITDGTGRKIISDLEWDTHNLSLNDTVYDFTGSIPLFPFILNPNITQELKLVMAPKDPLSLLVTVKDASSQLPLSEASVTLNKIGYNNILITGRGFLRQTDWSGGGGQDDFIDLTRYYDSDGNIDIANPAGELRLEKILNEYEPAGNLTSSTFDTGSASNFHQLIWQPQDQPPETGVDAIKFQLATNNDKATWNFLGPDGTVNTFYTLTDTDINSLHDGDQYLRYQVFLQTASTTFTPNLADVALTFTSSCVPPGQVLFSGLGADEYNLMVSKSGYQTFFDDAVVVSASWQSKEVTLSP